MAKTLDSLKTGIWSRGLALTRMGWQARQLIKKSQGDVLDPDNLPDNVQKILADWSKELGQLKGSLMKVGQMISVYGEHFLPREANIILKSLQSQSPPLKWPEMQKILKTEWGTKLSLWEVEQTSFASASIGQVHKGFLKEKPERTMAIKIQYPGIEKAIDKDLQLLKLLFKLAKWIPDAPATEEIFEEVRLMLHQEMDYTVELKNLNWFRSQLEGDERYVLPDPLPEYCTSKVLALNFEPCLPVDSPVIKSLSQERRNRLALSYLDLYYRELFEFRRVQTDPHAGNYGVRLDPQALNDKIVLFDFGAVREAPEPYIDAYRMIVRGALTGRREELEAGALSLRILHPDDSKELRQTYWELCNLIVEPFQTEGDYDWGGTDLPRRVARKGAELGQHFPLRTPPRESIFLDRKLGGSFVFVSLLGAKIRARPLLEKYVNLR